MYTYYFYHTYIIHVYTILIYTYTLHSEGDFPDINEYTSILKLLDFTTFPYTKRETLLLLYTILHDEIPLIMTNIHTAGVKKGQNSDHQEGAKKSTNKNSNNTNNIQIKANTTTNKAHSKSIYGILVFFTSFIVLFLSISIGLVYAYKRLPGEVKLKYVSEEQKRALDRVADVAGDVMGVVESLGQWIWLQLRVYV